MADIKAKKVLFKNRDGEYLIPYVGDTAIDHRITNCLLEVPQNIKLELNNGTLTLKKGSKVIVPNGAGVFDEVVIENDMKYDTSETNLATGVFFVHYNGNTHLGYALTSTSSSGTTAPAKTGLFYDTTNNIVKWNNNGSLVGRNRSLPLAIVTVTSGTGVTAIDQIFNGMGYIGSNVWVDKGVKGLIPNGRNEDGTLNNIEFTTDKILMQTQPNATANIDLYLSKTGVFRSTTIYYNEKLNFNISSTNGTNAGTVLIGNCTLTSGAISNFQPKLPFRAVDYNEIPASRFDGKWVRKSQRIAEGVSLAVTTTATTIEYDLASYLPNDSYKYEVMVSIDCATGAKVGAGMSISLYGTGTSNDEKIYLRAINVATGSNFALYQGNCVNVPIGTNRKLGIHYAVNTIACYINGLHLEGYRRIGTNA